MVDICHKQVASLNPDLIAVKLRMQVVEKYKAGCLLFLSAKETKASC